VWGLVLCRLKCRLSRKEDIEDKRGGGVKNGHLLWVENILHTEKALHPTVIAPNIHDHDGYNHYHRIHLEIQLD